MQILLPIVVACVPLLIAPHLLFYFDVTPKILVIVFGASLALFFLVRDPEPLQMLLASRIGRWFCILLAAQEISLLASTLTSADPWLSWNGGNWRRFGLIPQTAILIFVLLATAHLATARWRLYALLRVMVVTGGVAALYGVFQYFGWDPLQPSAGYHVGEGVWKIARPPGTLGHATYFATYLLFAVFIGAALLMTEQRNPWKSIAAIASGLAVFAIILSGTRAAILGLFIGAGVLLIWSRPRLRIIHVVLAGGLFAALIAFYYSPPGVQLRARMRWSMEDARGGARLLLWRDSLRMASQRPALGYGPESFELEFPKVESVELARAYPDFYHESPHNMFLDTLVSQGVLGLLILAAFAGLGLYSAASARYSEPTLARTLGSGLIAVIVAQQFTSWVAVNALYFGLLIGILAACGQLPSPGRQAAFKGTWAFLPVAVVFCVFGFRLFLSDYYLQRFNVSFAMRDYAQVIRWHPAGSSADLFYSRRMMALAFPEALTAGIRATRTSEERQNAWYNLAELYAIKNNAEGMEQSLRSSIACAPNWFKPHWILAQVLRATGRTNEARMEAEIAVSLNGGKNPEVNRTLDQTRSVPQN